MSHQYGIHYRKFVVFEVVLFQNAKALSRLHLDGSLVGFQIAADGSQQGRLSCAIGTNDAIDVTTCKLQIDVLVERLFTKLDSQICNCYHVFPLPYF